VMTYSFARISAAVGMRVEDYYANGKRWWVRLYEKGGKRHEMPAHHKLEQYLDEHLLAAGICDDDKTPLFRSTTGRTGVLTERSMHRIDAYQMSGGAPPRPALRASLAVTCFARLGSRPILSEAERWKMPRLWLRTKVRERPSFMTAEATTSRSMRSNAFRFEHI